VNLWLGLAYAPARGSLSSMRGIVQSAVIVLFSLPACGSGSGPSESPPDTETPVVPQVASMDVSPASITIRTGGFRPPDRHAGDRVVHAGRPPDRVGERERRPHDHAGGWRAEPGGGHLRSRGPVHVSATVETPTGPYRVVAMSSSTPSASPRVHVLPTMSPRSGSRSSGPVGSDCASPGGARLVDYEGAPDLGYSLAERPTVRRRSPVPEPQRRHSFNTEERDMNEPRAVDKVGHADEHAPRSTMFCVPVFL
jgi:hypothetical protein